jgi:hypothetical protein
MRSRLQQIDDQFLKRLEARPGCAEPIVLVAGHRCADESTVP